MSLVEKIAIGLVIAFFVLALGRLFKSPLKLVLRLGINAALGFGAVWVLNLTTGFTGLSLGLNWFNAVTIGILGVPGFFLLLLLKWVLI